MRVLSVGTFVNVVVVSKVYALKVTVFVTPFKVTFTVLAFLLLTLEKPPLIAATTVVAVLCLVSVNVVIYGIT